MKLTGGKVLAFLFDSKFEVSIDNQSVNAELSHLDFFEILRIEGLHTALHSISLVETFFRIITIRISRHLFNGRLARSAVLNFSLLGNGWRTFV